MKKVVLIKGDGIGPEIADAVVRIFEAAKAPIEWIEMPAGLSSLHLAPSGLPQATIDAIRTHGIALKSPTTTPSGSGHKSVNVTLRKTLELYANVRPARSLPGVTTLHENINLVIIRENVEDTYAGIEHMQTPDVAQGLKIITRPGSMKICRYAFELARRMGRKRLGLFHKANIHKLTDGLFLKVFYEVAGEYPDIEASDILVDNLCMQLVKQPQQFELLVGTNLYGDIISDLAAGLVGGLGVAPGGNIGDDLAVFEAVHGSAPDIAGKGLANPTALLLSATMMLNHLGYSALGDAIADALERTFQDGIRTHDLGGQASTGELTTAIIDRLRIDSASQQAAVTPERIHVSDANLFRDLPMEPVGIDVFVHCDTGIPKVPEHAGDMHLHVISNRGTKVYPGPTPVSMLVDWYRCRYFTRSSDGTPLTATFERCMQLLREFDRQGFVIVHTEILQKIDGEPGFLKAQGE